MVIDDVCGIRHVTVWEIPFCAGNGNDLSCLFKKYRRKIADIATAIIMMSLLILIEEQPYAKGRCIMRKLAIVAILVVVLFACSMPVASATAPSRTITDMTRTVIIEDVAPPLAGYTVEVSGALSLIDGGDEDVDPDFAWMRTELGNIEKFVNEQKEPVAKYFGNAVVEKIKSFIPATHKVEDMKLNEFIPAKFMTTSNASGGATGMEFPTAYRLGQVVVGVIGTRGSTQQINWDAAKAAVHAVNGKNVVVVDYTQEHVQRIGGNSFALAILSE